MRRVVAFLLVVANMAGCLSAPGTEDPGESGDEWPDASFGFTESGGPDTGFLIFMELADPREGDHDWSYEMTLDSLHEEGAMVWSWEFGLVFSAANDRFFTPRPGYLEQWESWNGVAKNRVGNSSASVGGSDLLGIVYGFASPAEWSIDLSVDYDGTGFAAVHHWPITGFDVHEEVFDGSIGYSEGSASFDLEGVGWTLAVLHRIETFPQRGYQTSITFPSGYTCSDTWFQSGVRIPPDEAEMSDWFAHFDDRPGTFEFEASDAGLDALESLQVSRLRFDDGLPDALPFPDHAEGVVSLPASSTTCPE